MMDAIPIGVDPLEPIAKAYHEETEAYDLEVCSGRNDQGVAVPIDGKEYSKIQKNAQLIRKIKINQALELGFSASDFQKAVIRYRP